MIKPNEMGINIRLEAIQLLLLGDGKFCIEPWILFTCSSILSQWDLVNAQCFKTPFVFQYLVVSIVPQ